MQRQVARGPADGACAPPSISDRSERGLRGGHSIECRTDLSGQRYRDWGWGRTLVPSLGHELGSGVILGGGIDFDRCGFAVAMEGGAYPAAWDVESAFGRAHGSVSAWLPVPPGPRPTLMLRAGAARAWGRYPVQEAAFLGGSRTLHGYPAQRFAGDAAVHGAVALRAPLLDVDALSGGTLGAHVTGSRWAAARTRPASPAPEARSGGCTSRRPRSAERSRSPGRRRSRCPRRSTPTSIPVGTSNPVGRHASPEGGRRCTSTPGAR